MKKNNKIKIKYLQKNISQIYLDQSEKFLFNFFDQPQSRKEKKIIEILNNNPSWPIIYHLSPQRNFLLDWYPFKKNSELLEIGAGCGAMTSLFIKKVKKVCANELTEERGLIIAKRYSDSSNLEIVIGNIINYDTKNKFDYATLIGVLEYAGKFIKNKKNDFFAPYLSLLKKIKTFLKQGGHLIIAIENKLGLKYLAGRKEDHYGKLFESIENYPTYQGIRTFSKNELIDLLKKAGYKKINFYYPFPDYKIPSIIFSDEDLSQKNNISKSSYISTINSSNDNLPFFNEIIMADSLDRENLLGKFSNSFLIDAVI